MRNLALIFRLVCALMPLLFGFDAASWAQGSARSQPDIAALIEQLGDDEEKVAFRAVDELLEAGQPAVAPLRELLKKEKACRPRVLAAGTLLSLAPDSEIIVPNMLSVLKDGCYLFSPRKDMTVRQQAALVLANLPAGVGELAGLLKDKSLSGRFERRSAVYAFDELTEKIEGVRPDSIALTPEMLAAIKAAMPLLVMAIDDKDETVRCVAYESLDQLRESRHKELRDEASRLMQGTEARCSR